MNITASPIHACFEAWMRCEDVLNTIALAQKELSTGIAKVIDECALICMSTFQALKINSVNHDRYALLCIGICEECAELCDQLQGEKFRQCALTCRQCSQTMSAVLFAHLQ